MADRTVLARATAAVGAAVLAGGVSAAIVHAPGQRTHPGRRALPATTVAPATTTSLTVPTGDPDVTGEVQPPTPGLYRYRETSAAKGQAGSEWAVQIAAAGDALTVKTTRGVDQTVRFGPFAEVELAFSQAGDTVADEVTCAEQPPRLLLQLPLQPGATWTTDTTCTNLLSARLLDHRRVTVTGRRNETVGKSTIPVWELVVVSQQTEQPAAFSRSVTSTIDVSARSGLVVRQVVQQGSDPATIVTDQLVSLTPA